MLINDAWLRKEYDKAVAESGPNGQPLAKTRDQVMQRALDLIETGAAELESMNAPDAVRRRFDSAVNPVRRARKSSYLADVTAICAARSHGPLLGESDPVWAILDHAYPIGDRDGTDKAMRWWSLADIGCSLDAYRENTERVAEVEEGLRHEWLPIQEQMKDTGARWVSDLFAA